MAFAFDLAARLPSIDRLVGDPREMVLAFGGRPVTVSALDGLGNLADAGWVRFSCGGFESEADARRFAVEFRERLRLAAIRGKFGIAIDHRVERASIVEYVDEAVGQPRWVRSIAEGIQTYAETGADTLVWAMSPSIGRQYGPQLLGQHLEAVAELAWPSQDERLSLACDLVNGLDFESTVRARFIRLVTALEALAGDRPDHSSPLLELVTRWQQELKAVDRASMTANELESFRGQLRDIRQVSIKSTLRSLVTRHAPGAANGESNEQFLARCYDTRSALLHDGAEQDIRDRIARLRTIVEAVVLGMASDSGSN